MHKTGGRSRSSTFPFARLPLPAKPCLAFDVDFLAFFFFFFLAAEGVSVVSASTGSASGSRSGQAGDVDREVWVEGGVGSMSGPRSSVPFVVVDEVEAERDEGLIVASGRWSVECGGLRPEASGPGERKESRQHGPETCDLPTPAPNVTKTVFGINWQQLEFGGLLAGPQVHGCPRMPALAVST